MNHLINLITTDSPNHKHKNYEIIIYTEGKGVFSTETKDIETCPGKIIIIPPGTVHRGIGTDKCFERIYINGEFNHLFNISFPVVIEDNSNREGFELARMIYNNRFADCEYIAALISAFTHFLLSKMNIENEIFLAIKSIIEEITDNFHDCDIALSSLLNKSGYSEDYIRAQFKKITGKTPTEFLTETRISHARYLIGAYRNSIPLSDISEQCGFTDYVYFSRRFKQITGVSPRNYMEQEC